MEKVIANPLDDFEKSCIPEMQELLTALKEKKVLLTKNDIYEMVTTDEALKTEMNLRGQNIPYLSYKGDDSLFYQDTKNVNLSLFAKRNKWSTIEDSSEVTLSNISYNNYQSLACLAQNQRHRTIDLEMKVPEDNITYTIPLFLEGYPDLTKEYLEDLAKITATYPLGMKVKVNMNATYANLFNYVTKERCCMMAQNEIANMYTFEIIPYIYNSLLELANTTTDEEKKNLYLAKALMVKEYLNKYRCSFPDYHCPSPCKSINLKRKL